MNVASLTSIRFGSERSVIFTRHCDVSMSGTFHEYEPVAASVLPIRVIQFTPPLKEYSILIFATPDEDHVIFCVEPDNHSSPPSGAVMLRKDFGEIVKVPSLISRQSLSVTTNTLTRQLEDTSSGTSHEYDLREASILSTIDFHVEPLSDE